MCTESGTFHFVGVAALAFKFYKTVDNVFFVRQI